MDTVVLYERSATEFGKRVHAIGGKWRVGTPCPDWEVRALVNHLVYEERWAPHLLAGAQIDDIGDRFDGDLLGDDPVTTWHHASAAAVAAVETAVPDATVHLSFGDFPAREYVTQLAADHLVHAWDLARALDTDETLDPDAVAAVLEWFGPVEPHYRKAGVIGPRVTLPEGASPQDRLLAMFGRRP